MGDVPVLKPGEVVRLLERHGFREVRQRGSHRQYRHDDGRSTTVTPGATTGDHPVKTFTKLIEVAIPLEKINEAAAREKCGPPGHHTRLHKWWAPRPVATARAVIFAQMVDDPSAHPDRFPTEEARATERDRLFAIIEELVKWESTTNEEVLEGARGDPPLLARYLPGLRRPSPCRRTL